MKVGFIGLGKMGSALVTRALQDGHEVVGFDTHKENSQDLKQHKNFTFAHDLKSLVDDTRILWLMVPAGKIVDNVLDELKPHLAGRPIIVDGGNSKFTDSIRRAKELETCGVHFLDCGTSGGIRGKEIGFSLMVGGNQDAYDEIKPLLQSLAAPNGFGYMGPSGAGHYVKMVHNGIEYALMQSYAEGFHLLKDGHFKELDLAKISSVWYNGSVIRSWLLELCHEIFLHPETLQKISGSVAESGMAQWTIEDAHKHDIPVQLIEDALEIRFWSQETGGNYATKVVAMLRNKFGGHEVQKK
ncbi:MAG: phosphogluconate dehydrogenase (NAD(+)-dependent, decarboxylating) [Candidatus Babeliales bacterium]